jgi:hypothetical protein
MLSMPPGSGDPGEQSPGFSRRKAGHPCQYTRNIKLHMKKYTIFASELQSRRFFVILSG